MGTLSGHLWTISRSLRHELSPAREPRWQPWTTTVEEPLFGELSLSGRLSLTPGSEIVVVLHGLGGSAASSYSVRTAQAAVAAGMSCLRLNMRGADEKGPDFYHAGLVADLEAALESPEVKEKERVFALGYSLGGHQALRMAARNHRVHLHAVAAVCSPIDLDGCARSIDRPGYGLYRRYLMRKLVRQALACRSRGGKVPDPESVRSAKTIREWDRLVVAPRFGFDSSEEYYQKESVGPRLPRINIPAILVASEHDPWVPATTVRPWLAQASPMLRVCWSARGGHVGFPGNLDLGLGGLKGLEPQLLHWLRASASPAMRSTQTAAVPSSRSGPA